VSEQRLNHADDPLQEVNMLRDKLVREFGQYE